MLSQAAPAFSFHIRQTRRRKESSVGLLSSADDDGKEDSVRWRRARRRRYPGAEVDLGRACRRNHDHQRVHRSGHIAAGMLCNQYIPTRRQLCKLKGAVSSRDKLRADRRLGDVFQIFDPVPLIPLILSRRLVSALGLSSTVMQWWQGWQYSQWWQCCQCSSRLLPCLQAAWVLLTGFSPSMSTLQNTFRVAFNILF